MSEPPNNICGYQFPPGYEPGPDGTDTSRAVHYSSCYRTSWRDGGRCIWHAKTEDAKPTELLAQRRETQESRDLNGGTGPAELLDGASLPGASLDGLSKLDGCSLRRANLQDVHLSEGSCRNANFADANLDEAWLRGTDFAGASFSQVSFRDTTLRGADLTSCKLEDAHLERTNLLDATLSDIRLYGATVANVRINLETTLRSQYQTETDWTGLRAARPFSIYDPRLGVPADQSPVTPSFTKAIYTYNELAECAKDNSLSQLRQQLHVRAQDAHLLSLGDQLNVPRVLTMRLSRAVFLYGESLFRVLFISGLVSLGYALLYTGSFAAVPGASSGGPLAGFVESTAVAVLTALFVFVLGHRSQH